jgi:branched-subunit amino acid transport protein
MVRKEAKMRLWLIIIAAGAITFAIRLSFIWLLSRWQLPDWFRTALKYVPPAVLSAILVPELVNWNGMADFSWHNPQILAGLLAALVAWRTRSVFLSLAAGIAVFFVLVYLIN